MRLATGDSQEKGEPQSNSQLLLGFRRIKDLLARHIPSKSLMLSDGLIRRSPSMQRHKRQAPPAAAAAGPAATTAAATPPSSTIAAANPAATSKPVSNSAAPVSTSKAAVSVAASTNPVSASAPASVSHSTPLGSSTVAVSKSTSASVVVSSAPGGSSVIIVVTPSASSTPVAVSTPAASTPTIAAPTSNAAPTTQAEISSSYTYTTTNAAGQTYTVTGLVSGATGAANGNATGSSSFFQNKGAVAAIFVIAGLAGTAILLVGMIVLVRRRRAKQLEKEAALTAADAARTTRKPPSEYDEDDMGPAMSEPEMTQRNIGGGAGYGGPAAATGYGTATYGYGNTYGNTAASGAGAPGGRGAYGERPYDNGRNAGYGGAAAVVGAAVGAGATRGTRERGRGNSPPPNDYYSSAPYNAGNANAGYPPQPMPAYSRSSHGDKDDQGGYGGNGQDEFEDYAGATGLDASYGSKQQKQPSQQQYGQSQGRGGYPDAYAGAGAPRNVQNTQRSTREQDQYEAYGGLYEDDDQQFPSPLSDSQVNPTPQPQQGGRVPIQKQNVYVPPASTAPIAVGGGGRPGPNPSGNYGNDSYAGRAPAPSARRDKGDSTLSDKSYYGHDNLAAPAAQRLSALSEASNYTVDQPSYQQGQGQAPRQQESTGYGSTAYGRELTPQARGGGGNQNQNQRLSAASASIYDDGASAMSFYSDEEDPRVTAGLGPKRSLRIANE
ncbi:hypothetical protein FRB93_005449 [Tulasnella sp. JGI-2019a]|nr:hypothetical protein FRB93_005449 [Tulasnella sp. JGI-2019a]